MSTPSLLHWIVTAEETKDSSPRLDHYLVMHTGKSRAYIQEQIKLAVCTVNANIVLKPSHALKINDVVNVVFKEVSVPSGLTPVAGKLSVLYEDEHIIAINKPAGMVVHPGAGVHEPTLVHYLLHYFGRSHQNHADYQLMAGTDSERPGIVHRLDVGTSGVILVAKNRETLEALSSLFKQRKIKKTYEAIVWGKMLLSGKFDSPIGRDIRNRQKMSSKTSKARSAVTRWQALERFQHFTYVSLFPETGRTHQLRVHLSEGGHSIVGDPTYGKGLAKRSLLDPAITGPLAELNHTFLHAKSLELTHPISQKQLTIEAALPKDFSEFIPLLRKHNPCPTK